MNRLNYPLHRRHLLKSVLSYRPPQHKILKEMLHGSGHKQTPPSSGWLTGAGSKGSELFQHNIFKHLKTEDSMGGLDHKRMESAVDEMVASSLVHGRQTSSVLRILFGLVPSLIGR